MPFGRKKINSQSALIGTLLRNSLIENLLQLGHWFRKALIENQLRLGHWVRNALIEN